MEEIISAIKARLNSPLFGYFALAVVAFNWEAFFFLLVQSDDVTGRIEFFKQHTTIFSLILWPVVFAFAVACAYPWVIYVLTWLTAKPVELRDVVQANAEHRVLIKRAELEDARSKLLATKESELIERAKRDQDLDSIQNEDLREKIRAELEQLRAERDSLQEGGQNQSAYARHKELMEIAGTYRARAQHSGSSQEKQRFVDRARQLEEQAYSLISNTTISSGHAQHTLGDDAQNARASEQLEADHG